MLDNRNNALVGPCLCVVAILATVSAAKYAQDLLSPVLLALVLGVVLSPLAYWLEKLRIPRAAAAGLLLALAWGSLVLLIAMLGPVLTTLLAELPFIEARFRSWIRELAFALPPVGGIDFELEQSLSQGSEDAMEGAIPTLADALWLAPNLLAQMLIFSGTLFFFVLTRDQIYGAFPSYRRSLQSADRSLSHYFVTIALVNAGLGVSLFLVLTAIGLPNAMLWGTAAFFANFVLYLGPLTLMAALGLAGIMTFDTAHAFLPPLAFLMLNAIESQFVTPSLVGKRMSVNPLIVFLSIVFGLWLWGPLGGIVSLPLVIWAYAFVTAQSKRGVSSDYAMERVA